MHSEDPPSPSAVVRRLLGVAAGVVPNGDAPLAILVSRYRDAPESKYVRRG